ncbi:BlaR1 peptidase M56 [Albidovulum inexpectatum]|uniref:BlaR1 peptidase M56 n=1 Tax=Albidovulum inexpectatum TaxID=196587 RepID=A0A2S5JJM9_9RHOB|nr:M56 family metallopeptidase [Albidovulum inexpectatum]PPB81578.1 BlaR1 peptidase M56 [Albidovulum inexpectatum]
MTDASGIIGAYLELNVVFLVVCLAWLSLSRVMDAIGLGHVLTARLHLSRLLFLLAVAAPALASGLHALGRRGIADIRSLNLSDFMLAQYLQGNIRMQPSAMERVVGFHDGLAQTLSGPVGQMLGAALVAGMALMCARLFCAVSRLHTVLKGSYCWRSFGAVDLRLSDTIRVPFSARTLRRRVIVLPTAMLGRDGDLRMALSHELQHLRQGDVEWELAISLVQPFLFWNPAFHLWKRHVEELREAACDRALLSRRGYAVADYCDCLLRVCNDGLRPRGIMAVELPAVALVRPLRGRLACRAAILLRRRILRVMEGRAERHPRLAFALLSAPLAILTLVVALAIQKPGAWSEDRIMLSTIVNLERLRTISATGAFGSPRAIEPGI